MDENNPYFAGKVFSIKNSTNENFDFPMIKRNQYSNVIKPNILNLPNIRQGTQISEPFTPQTETKWDMPDLSIPLLNQHFHDLSYLWKDFKERSIIINRRTLRRLINNEFDIQLSVKNLIVDGQERLYYILNAMPTPFSTDNIDQVTPLLVQKPTVEYTDYICKEIAINEFSSKVYYTSEIDAFDPISKLPIEIKGLKYYDNTYEMAPRTAYNTAIQCHLAGVNDILTGFYSENNMVLKMFTLDDLKYRAANGGFYFDEAIAKTNFILNEIFDYADTFRGYLSGKMINIQKNEFNEQLFFQKSGLST